MIVSTVVAAFIPEPECNQYAGCRGFFRKVGSLPQIAGEGLVVIPFEAVQGDVDLVQTGGKNGIAPLFQQSSVGGDHRPESFPGSHLQEQGKIGVRQRFAHEVVVNIFCLSLQLIQYMAEGPPIHFGRFAGMSVTKRAMHVTDVGDLYINP